MAAAAGLDTGLLVSTEDVVFGAKRRALPPARIQVQNRSGLFGEAGITRKDPVLVTPRFDGIRIQNAPHGAATDRCAQRGADPGSDVSQGLSAQGLLGCRNPFTGHCLDQRLVQRGKRRACAPVLRRPPRKSPQRPTAYANVGPEPPKGPRVGQPPHGARTVPCGAAGQAGIAGRTDTEPSCVGPRSWLPVKSPRGRQGRTSGWAQTCGASSQSVRYKWFCLWQDYRTSLATCALFLKRST